MRCAARNLKRVGWDQMGWDGVLVAQTGDGDGVLPQPRTYFGLADIGCPQEAYAARGQPMCASGPEHTSAQHLPPSLNIYIDIYIYIYVLGPQAIQTFEET